MTVEKIEQIINNFINNNYQRNSKSKMTLYYQINVIISLLLINSYLLNDILSTKGPLKVFKHLQACSSG